MQQYGIHTSQGNLECYIQIPDELQSNVVAIVLPTAHKHELDCTSDYIKTIMYKVAERGYVTFGMHYRGMGNSSGTFDEITEEVINTSTLMDWIMQRNNTTTQFMLVGLELGGAIATHVMMRRPEIEYFFIVDPLLSSQEISKFDICTSKGKILVGNSTSGATSVATNIKIKIGGKRNSQITVSSHKKVKACFIGSEDILLKELSDFLDVIEPDKHM